MNTKPYALSASANEFIPKEAPKDLPTNLSSQAISFESEMLPLEFYLPLNLLDEDDEEINRAITAKKKKTVRFDLTSAVQVPSLEQSYRSFAFNTVSSSKDLSICSEKQTETTVNYELEIAESTYFKTGLMELKTAEKIYNDTESKLAAYKKKSMAAEDAMYDQAIKGPYETLLKTREEASKFYKKQRIATHIELTESIGIRFVSCCDDQSLLNEQLLLARQAMDQQCKPLLTIDDLFKRIKEELSGVIYVPHVSALDQFMTVTSDKLNEALCQFISTTDFSMERHIIELHARKIPGFNQHSLHTMKQFNKALLSAHKLENYSINENDFSSACARDMFSTFNMYFKQEHNAVWSAKRREADLVYKQSTQRGVDNYRQGRIYVAKCYEYSLSYLSAYSQQLAIAVATRILEKVKLLFIDHAQNIHEEMIYQLLRNQLTSTAFKSLTNNTVPRKIRIIAPVPYPPFKIEIKGCPRFIPKIVSLTEPVLSNLIAFAEITQDRIQEKQLNVISCCSSTMFRASATNQDDSARSTDYLIPKHSV